MTVWQKGIITLIRSALDDACYELPQEFSLEEIVDIASEHQVSPLVYYGAKKYDLGERTDTVKKLFDNALPLALLDQRQREEFSYLTSLFDEEKIEYLPLKGSVLKQLYPRPEMRTMGDIDILIKTEQYEKVAVIMQKNGYEFQYESDHEFVWKKEAVIVELHKRVMTSYNEDFFAYFSDGWNFAKKISDTYKYTMSDEDFYVYMFVHFAKHYRVSGIGIKHLIDLWVYEKEKPLLDWEYIGSELEKLHLHEFFENVEKTLDVWFGGASETEVTEIISDVVFGSGAYGDAETAEISNVLRETQNGKSVAHAKLNHKLRILFLPYDKMCEKYNVLRKIPVLLPVMWFVRFCAVVLLKRDKMFAYLKKEKRITGNTIEAQRKKLNAVGLDFYFEE